MSSWRPWKPSRSSLPQEEVEEHRLKKVKLQLKDQMNQIISRYRTQHVPEHLVR